MPLIAIIKLQIKNALLTFIVLTFTLGLSYGQDKKTKKESDSVEITEKVEILEIDESEFIPFSVVDKVPYPLDCESYKTKAKLKKCTVEYIQNHSKKNFNTGLGAALGLTPSVQRILVRFKFDTSGNIVDLEARGAHPEIEKEAERVVKLLPRFIPGEHQGEVVKVAYVLPIVYAIPEKTTKADKQ
ncbi:hypothetical protein BWZ20_07150 [Winogradskyella sp. J14-2]|uniref:energy transducer TonB n=1 Tax=Winogradskyella sp. J14-2 TaxID=1936080 RepID=UPI0009729FC3|nr:energy transducer TonB [Winogradskyella sp. J14-2]APY08088.1 hypothetical protein BWZ20_07150 [Winogradskyella sp. J14-2]